MKTASRPLKIFKASAGSGKTFTLTVEYIKLLMADPTNYKHILAVTFTNKATAEMKQRILSQLYGIGHCLKDSDDYIKAIMSDDTIKSLGMSEGQLRERALIALQMMMHDYSRFRIETIDSFFHSIVCELAHELDLTANLRIDLNDDEVLQEAVSTLINDLQQGTPLFRSVYEFVQERIREDKNWKIDYDVTKFGHNIFNEEFIERKKLADNHIGDYQFLSDYKRRINMLCTTAKESAQSASKTFMNICNQRQWTASDFAGKSRGIFPFFEKIASCSEADMNAGTMALSPVAHKYLNNPSEWSPKGRDDVSELAASTFIPLLQQIVNAHQVVNTVESVNQHINKLMLIDEINQRVRTLNADANRFLLADTAHVLRDLISDSDIPFIYERTGVRFTHIMIDEFQDTSRLQWQNFCPLLNNSLSINNTCLIVGDVKQSIYRWRNSDWSILNNMSDGEFGNRIEQHDLKTNFRSAERVVNFNNDFFQKTAKALNLLYEQKTHHSSPDISRAYEDVAQLVNPKHLNYGFVRLECVKDNEQPPTPNVVRVSRFSREETDPQLPRLLANVQRLRSEGVNPNDICILIRKNDLAAVITEYFAQNMPDVSIVNNEAYRLDSSPAISIITLALTLLSNPSDKYVRMLLAHRYQMYVMQHTENSNLNSLLLLDEAAVNELLPKPFCQYETELAMTPLYELTERLYGLFDLQRIPHQDAYLFAFFDQLSAYLADNPTDIDHFLQFWNENMCGQTVPTGNVDGIRMMTIHKSKGLEFHTVIVPFCDWQLGKGSDLLWCEPSVSPYNELPLLPVTNKQSLTESIFKADYEQELLKAYVDNLNIVYVAFTRARQNLIVLTGTNSDSTVGGLINSAIGNTGNYETGSIVASETDKKQQEKKENVLTITPQVVPVSFTHFDSTTQFLQSNQSRDFIHHTIEQEQTDAKPETTDEAQALSYIDEGVLFHNLLSEIQSPDDIDSAISRFDFMGYFPNTFYRDRVLALVRQAFENAEAARWFDPHWQVINECAIIYADAKGVVHQQRPDRVITDGHETIVIDYKTGHPMREHFGQVRRYMHLLAQMGHTRIRGYLWYVRDGKIKAVE